MLFVHVSDIHFDERHVGQPDDPDLALRDEMLRDVKHMRLKLGKADGLLLGGDTAFAATEKEFEFAFAWIRDKLCPAAGCDLSQVFSVPGNHDVSRKADRPVYELARAGLLQLNADELDDTIRRIVRDKPSSKLFFDPLENYNKFAARFLCSIGPFDKGTEPGTVVLPHARRDLKMEDGSTLRLWGFNSVLVSDRKDAERRMLVDPSAGQIERDEGVTHLVMCHHPFGWLRNGEEFRSRIERVSKLHLFGHEHTLRFEDAHKFARIRAGALHPERKGPKWKPGYNWIDIRVEGRNDDRRLRLKVWTRQYDSDRFLGLGDDEGNEHWDRSYPLDPWSAPAAAPTEEAEIPVLLTPPVDEAAVHVPALGVSLRDLTLHAYEIRVDQQRALLAKLGLDQESEPLPDHRVGTALVARAFAADCTERLRTELEALAPSKGDTKS